MSPEKPKTDRAYWEEYWRNFVPFKLEKILFEDILEKLPDGKKDFLEIGGFPGTFSTYLKKNKNYDVTLLDYFIDGNKLNEMAALNSLPKNSVRAIEADFFEYNTDKKYDFVMSNGFIEHFDDPAAVIERHASLLKDGGLLLLTLPNFLGLNGLVQKVFDKKNHQAHNLAAMDITRLKKMIGGSGLKDIEITYYGKPCLWLEKNAPVGLLARNAVRVMSKIISELNFKNKFLSPYIVATAKK